MSAFTCAACGGFQYNKVPVMRGGPNDLICQDCYENGAMDAPGAIPMLRAGKPGLHEVLVSIHEAEYSMHCNYSDWIQSNGDDEEAAAEKCQQARPELWKEYYQRVIGEPWQ